jgi:GNAT superfamily N-acetyltransferase
MPKIVLTDSPDPLVLQKLVRSLIAFHEEKAGPRDFRQIAITVSDSETDEVLGGLWGGTTYGQLKIEVLYLPEPLRGTGLGRQLIEQAEAEALARGCHASWLETFSFQARGFYQRMGYSVFGVIDDFPKGHSLYFLTKALGAL